MYDSIIKYIRELHNTPEEFLPLHEPRFKGNEKKYLDECIDSTFVSSVGKFVDEFENAIAKYTGSKKAVVCVNGTNALSLAMQLVGVCDDDEVITQSLTFVATGNAILYLGAKPLFIDVDKETMGLSPQKMLEWLLENAEICNSKTNEVYSINKNTGKRIKACVPMHTFGHPCKIDELLSICKKYGIELVEDAAESIGSYYKGKHTGTFGSIGVLSFNGNKTITTGGGGMLLFNDELLAEKAKHLTTQAKIPHKWEFAHDCIGYNLRMPNLNAALGLAQLEQLPDFLKAKRELALKYSDFFKELDIDFFIEPEYSSSSYWLNVVILKSKEEQQKFLEYTNDNGVMTRPIWKLMNKLPMFKNCECGDLSNSEWLEDRVVNIPSSVIM